MKKKDLIALLFLFILMIFHNDLIAQTYDLQIVKNQYEKLDTSSYLQSVENIVFNDYHKKDNYNIEGNYNNVERRFRENIPVFVLKIDIDTAKIFTDNYIKVDYSEKKFDIYFFDEYLHPSYYLFFVDDQLDAATSVFPTFSRNYGKKIKSALQKVIKKKPKYLLECHYLPNTILYVLCDKIYVHRVIQNKDYELNKYVKIFKNNEYFYLKNPPNRISK